LDLHHEIGQDDLHSFPTRRSSDLMLSLEGDNMIPQEFAGALEILRSSAHRMPKEQVQAVLRQELGDYEAKFGSLDLTPMAAASRSEEHTSELQSRENLVCRLLLEK